LAEAAHGVSSRWFTVPRDFEIISEITEIQVIAKGTGVRIRHHLNSTYGRGNWRKLKGNAVVEYTNGEVWLVELHWFEAHGIGRRDEKDKYKIRRIQ
jgi:hypothetical protein